MVSAPVIRALSHTPPAAYPAPVADLVSHHGPHDAEGYRVAQVEVPALDQEAGGQEYGLARQGHAGALQHHPEEEDQVTVLGDEGEDPVHILRV
jgi:hypothetical protein